MNPEYYQHLMDRLFKAGALDVFTTPIQMKKNRPGIKLSVLGKSGDIDQLVNVVLEESTSIGVRIISSIERVCLNREFKEVDTRWGIVSVKVARKDGKIVNIAPEYEDCLQIAKSNDIPLKKVYREVKKTF